ncbi:coiled-coil domain-containing protein [Streptomyces thermolilacinus]|uniref:hypothetical protein n=1 Tax=Streptomyces thermolilacinus TaxID=285540 RepID=UPI000416FEC6|nr:hypothetical protein [Streptomyces thermolilacinus]
MPRGRHRHSPPLHRLLPPSAVAGASILCAAGAWLLADPLGLRLLVAAAAAAAVTGAVLMRAWDRTAGRRVAELTRARASDQWKTEERIAELEADLEEARELRAKLDAKLRAKRVELAGLRNEHAELLRRYATAETERASALEGRRQLALGSSAPAGGKATTAGGEATTAVGAELATTSTAPTRADYLRAAQALSSLTRNAAAQEARRVAEAAARPAGPTAGATGTSALAMRPVPAAATIVPYAAQRRPVPRPAGSFDFFGTQKGARAQGSGKKPAAIEAAVQDEDLADVVGEEALAESRPTAAERDEEQAVGEVIDLTAHDETEQLDVAELRDAVSS